MVSVKDSIRGDRRPRRFFLRGNIMSAGANVLHSHMQTGATGSAIKLALGRMRHKLQAPCDCVSASQHFRRHEQAILRVGGYMQGCSGAGTRWNAVPANVLEPERRSGKYRWPQVER